MPSDRQSGSGTPALRAGSGSEHRGTHVEPGSENRGPAAPGGAHPDPVVAAEGEACERLMHVVETAVELAGRSGFSALGASGGGTPDDRVREPLLPFVLAQLRMRVRPALSPDWAARDPVHVSLFGGTNSGKSTVANVLVGRAAAGMRVTAAFSQHPVALRPAALGTRFLDDYPTRFIGYARSDGAAPARQSDADLARHGYRPALGVVALPDDAGGLTDAAGWPVVVWDVPDYSTESAQLYMSAVLETVALAEVVVMAVTDESYADDRGSGLLRMVSATGVCVHVVANKLRPGADLARDIKARLDENWRGREREKRSGLPTHRFHLLPSAEGDSEAARLANLQATPQAARFREAVAADAGRGEELKRECLGNAVAFIAARFDEVLGPLSAEVDAASGWARLVDGFDAALVGGYQREYLETHAYAEFNKSLVKLMELLEVPGIGPVLRLTRQAVAIPFTLLKAALSGALRLRDLGERISPEQEVLLRLFESWYGSLRQEAQQLARRGAHAQWTAVAARLGETEFRDGLLKSFLAARAAYQQSLDEEIARRAEAIYTELATRPALLNSLRGANLAASAGAVGLVVASHGIGWSDAVLAPIVTGLQQELLRQGLGIVVEKQQEKLKQVQLAAIRCLLEEQVAAPMRALFVAEIGAGDIARARQDLDLVRRAAARVVGEAER